MIICEHTSDIWNLDPLRDLELLLLLRWHYGSCRTIGLLNYLQIPPNRPFHPTTLRFRRSVSTSSNQQSLGLPLFLFSPGYPSVIVEEESDGWGMYT